ncbi:hypothetical protein HYH03_005380 [Edaphochlamys debaryana]|uniref:Guanylate cyclase domain-containing protein n=1 Tax=Edaphochlamys debaryana TaxID=47281 RepID=A0A836C281_9CHLO|nr:hypothetical protein HYH03_005380 [Edaphochlamys debaryana]|eukprot:KAG2496557.1 hypothetical protein HYH03_005380 [Edaphochlamys debaryana]
MGPAAGLGRLLRSCSVSAVLLLAAAAAAQRGSRCYYSIRNSCGFAGDSPATEAINGSYGPRLFLAGLLHNCVGDGEPNDEWGAEPRALRVVALQLDVLSSLAAIANDTFARATEIPVRFDQLPQGQYTAQRQAFLLDPNPPNATTGADALVASSTAVGDAAQVPGKLVDLSLLVSADPNLGWSAILPQLREASVFYNGAIVGLPLVVSPYFLMYRRDIFERDGLAVPQTWEEFTALAEARHGMDGMAGACVMAIGCRAESLTLRTILASYLQTRGTQSGFLWDPQNMDQLINSPAGEQALKIFRRLVAVGPQEPNTPSCVPDHFNRGNCLMDIAKGTRFKDGSIGPPDATVARGRMGFALLPGSTRVLDRATRQLAPCTKELCPLATESTLEDGQLRLVNRPITLTSLIVLLNGLSPVQYQFYAYQLFSLLTSSSIVGAKGGMLLQPNELLPMREEDLSLDHLPNWEASSYDRGDTERFLRVYRASVGAPNMSPDVKIRLTSNVTAALLAAALRYNSPSTPASQLPSVLEGLQRALDSIVEAEGGREAFASDYRRSIGWEGHATTAPVAAPRKQPEPSQDWRVAVAVAVPCGCAVLAAAVATAVLLVRRRRRQRHAAKQAGRDAPPGPGERTTLVVTDIFDSTRLWEALDASVMDEAISVHHRVMREAVAALRGYESSTEGDSFLLAFHAPEDALGFCLRAQHALLAAPWPPALLELPGAEQHGGLCDSAMAAAPAWEHAVATVTMACRQDGNGNGGAERLPLKLGKTSASRAPLWRTGSSAKRWAGGLASPLAPATLTHTGSFGSRAATSCAARGKSPRPHTAVGCAGAVDAAAHTAHCQSPCAALAGPGCGRGPMSAAGRAQPVTDGGYAASAETKVTSASQLHALLMTTTAGLYEADPRLVGSASFSNTASMTHAVELSSFGHAPGREHSLEAYAADQAAALAPVSVDADSDNAQPPTTSTTRPYEPYIGVVLNVRDSAALTPQAHTEHAPPEASGSLQDIWIPPASLGGGTTTHFFEQTTHVRGRSLGRGQGAAAAVAMAAGTGLAATPSASPLGSPNGSSTLLAIGARAHKRLQATRREPSPAELERLEQAAVAPAAPARQDVRSKSAATNKFLQDALFSTSSGAIPMASPPDALLATAPSCLFGTPPGKKAARGHLAFVTAPRVMPLSLRALSRAVVTADRPGPREERRSFDGRGANGEDRQCAGETGETLWEVLARRWVVQDPSAAPAPASEETAVTKRPALLLSDSQLDFSRSAGTGPQHVRPRFSMDVRPEASAAAAAAAALRRPGSEPLSGILQGSAQQQATAGAGNTGTLVFRGLRVRMGVHCGATEVCRNATSGRLVYGQAMQVARAVSDAGAGGLTLLTHTVREQLAAAPGGGEAALTQAAGGEPWLLLYAGCHVLDSLRSTSPGGQHLYQALPARLAGRLALPLPLRKASPVLPLVSALDAPASGTGCLARLSVVGAASLLAWSHDVAAEALAMLHARALAELRQRVAMAGAVTGSASASSARARAYVFQGAAGLSAPPAGKAGGARALRPRGPSAIDPAGFVRESPLTTGQSSPATGALPSPASTMPSLAAALWRKRATRALAQQSASGGAGSSSGAERRGSPRVGDGSGPAAGGEGAGVLGVALQAPPGLAVAWLLACIRALPSLDWPPELLEHPLAEDCVFRLGRVYHREEADPPPSAGDTDSDVCSLEVHWRGLRVACAVAWGELGGRIRAGSLAGHLEYRGRAARTLQKLAAVAKAGQVVVDEATAFHDTVQQQPDLVRSVTLLAAAGRGQNLGAFITRHEH